MASSADPNASGSGTIVLAPSRPNAKAKPRARRTRHDDDTTSTSPMVFSLVHRDDPSLCHPFDADLKCCQLPNGKKDRKAFGVIFGDIRAAYKDFAKNGATSVSLFMQWFWCPSFVNILNCQCTLTSFRGVYPNLCGLVQIVSHKLNIFSHGRTRSSVDLVE